MHSDFEALRAAVEAREDRTTSPAIGQLAYDPLTIPRACGVSPRIEKGAGTDADFAKLALSMYEAGLLSEADDANLPASALVKLGFDRWINGIFPRESSLNGFSVEIQEPELGDGPFQMWLHGAGAEEVHCVRSAMERLGRVHPSLAETVYSLIEMASFRTWSAWSARRAFSESSYIYWYGADNDEDYLEELMAMNDWTEEEMREEEGENMYLPSHFKSSLSTEMVFDSSSQYDEASLRELARTHPDEWVKKLCEIAADISMSVAAGHVLEGPDELTECQSAYPSVILRWDEKDDLVRTFDDFIEHANQCGDGYTDAVSAMYVPMEKEAFIAWEERTRKGLCLLALLDRAVALIVEHNEGGKND